MKYILTKDIDLPLPKVIDLFEDPDNWSKWRDGFESLKGMPGEERSVTTLINLIGHKETEMTETVEVKNLPAEMTCIYEATGWVRGIK
jgi:hypothetical protein